MVFFQKGVCLDEIRVDTSSLAPRQRNQRVNVISNHIGFRAVLTLHTELLEFAEGLFLAFGTHLGSFNLALDFLKFFVGIAQFFLNGFYLFIEVIIALVLFHCLLHTAANTLFRLLNVNFFLEHVKKKFKTFLCSNRCKQILLTGRRKNQQLGNGCDELFRIG